MNSASVTALKEVVFEEVAGYRQSLQEGAVVNLSGLEDSVRGYCSAIAALPKEEAQHHTQDLEDLMSQVSALGEKLTQAREEVRKELSSLGHMQRANVAYQKSDAIVAPRKIKNEDD